MEYICNVHQIHSHAAKSSNKMTGLHNARLSTFLNKWQHWARHDKSIGVCSW